MASAVSPVSSQDVGRWRHRGAKSAGASRSQSARSDAGRRTSRPGDDLWLVWPPSATTAYRWQFVNRTYRIVVAKPGLDGHDRGAKTITRALRDHGFEVIYTGLHQTPEQIAETVLQEDADGVGLSLLSGAHLTLFPRVMQELRSRDLGDVLVFGGGVIPDGDARVLREQGVAEIFGPGTSLRTIGAWLESALDESQ